MEYFADTVMNHTSTLLATTMASVIALGVGGVTVSAQLTVDLENRYPSVGAIMVWSVDEAGKPIELRAFVSGTLIRDRVMVTAGHFTAPVKALGSLPPSIRMFASFSPTDAKDPTTWIPVVGQVTHPSMPHCPPPPQCDPTDEILVAPLEPGIADVGLVFLASAPSSIRASRLADPGTLERSERAQMTIVGYGTTTPQDRYAPPDAASWDGKRRIRTSTLRKVVDETWGLWSIPSYVCSGDSGGAIFLNRNSRMASEAVLAANVSDGGIDCRRHNNNNRLDTRSIQNWIGDALRQHPGEPKSRSSSSSPGNWTPPRTPDGDPDLQGVWNYAAGTPLERPSVYGGREFLTDDELARAERELRERANADRRDGAGTNADLSRENNEFWFTRRKTILTRRTSLIVDPPDGKLPAVTGEAERRRSAYADYLKEHPADWEDRRLNERCIMYLQSGPPIIPFGGPGGELLLGFPFHFEIFQTRDHVVIHHEELNRRIIPLDGRRHLPSMIPQWLGDSRGRWEGNTLVIETTNFRDQRPYAGVVTTDHLRLVERLTRVDADTIDYRFTVEDPTTWTRPWRAAVLIEKSEGRLFEFACHETNYSLQHILSGARAQEKP
jgi:hypothetical protein